MVEQVINKLLILAKNKTNILSNIFVFSGSMSLGTKMPKNVLAVFALSKRD